MIEEIGEPLAEPLADTAASPVRNVSSRAIMTARASGGLSHGGPPVARASKRFR